MSEHVSCFDKQALGALHSELESRNRITFGSTLYEAFLMCLSSASCHDGNAGFLKSMLWPRREHRFWGREGSKTFM